jgi:hypothetical protein
MPIYLLPFHTSIEAREFSIGDYGGRTLIPLRSPGLAVCEWLYVILGDQDEVNAV